MIQTLLLFKFKLLCYHVNQILVSITTRSSSASLQMKGSAAKYTTVRWLIHHPGKAFCVKIIPYSTATNDGHGLPWTPRAFYRCSYLTFPSLLAFLDMSVIMRARQQVILGNLMNSLTRLNSLKTAQVQLISHLFCPQFAALRTLMTSMTCIAFVILTGSNYPIARNGGILIHFVVVSIVDKVGKNSGLRWFCFTFFSDWSRKRATLSTNHMHVGRPRFPALLAVCWFLL